MMKKITLLTFMFFAVLAAKAQTTIFSDDFDDADISDWTLLDEDGDGFNFMAYDPSVAQGGEEYHLSSASYDNETATALTPDNYAISPAIDISGQTELTLKYLVGGQDASFYAEVYTVYVSTGNTIADFMDDTKTVSFGEDLGDDPDAAQALVERELDLSALDGEDEVYIAFRHHDVTDQFILNFDDVVLFSAETAGLDDVSFADFSYYKDSQNNMHLKSSNVMEKLSVYSILGKEVKSQNLNLTETTMNLSSLSSGVYIMQVQIDGQAKSFKFIK